MTLVVIASAFFLVAICGRIRVKDHEIGTSYRPLRILLAFASIIMATIAYLMTPQPSNALPAGAVARLVPIDQNAPKSGSYGENAQAAEISKIKLFLEQYVAAFATDPESMRRFYASTVNPFFNFKEDTDFASILADAKKFARRFAIKVSELREVQPLNPSAEKCHFSVFCYHPRYDKKLATTDDKTFVLSGSLIKWGDSYRIVSIYNDEPRPELSQ